LDLEERENEFNIQKRRSEEKLREEEKRVFQLEIDAKKRIANEKRTMEELKQTVATEMATL
jgi:hypothetical protein